MKIDTENKGKKPKNELLYLRYINIRFLIYLNTGGAIVDLDHNRYILLRHHQCFEHLSHPCWAERFFALSITLFVLGACISLLAGFLYPKFAQSRLKMGLLEKIFIALHIQHHCTNTRIFLKNSNTIEVPISSQQKSIPLIKVKRYINGIQNSYKHKEKMLVTLAIFAIILFFLGIIATIGCYVLA